MPQTYYMCLRCGNVVSETDILNNVASGGLPYCYCEWTPEYRVYNKYEKLENNMKIKIADGTYTVEFTLLFDVIITSKEGKTVTLTESDLTVIYAAYKEMQAPEPDCYTENDIILESGMCVSFDETSMIEIYEDDVKPEFSLNPEEVMMIYAVNRQRILNQIEEDSIQNGKYMKNI